MTTETPSPVFLLAVMLIYGVSAGELCDSVAGETSGGNDLGQSESSVREIMISVCVSRLRELVCGLSDGCGVKRHTGDV